MSSSITVDLQSRSFSMCHQGVEHRFGIPEGYDIRTSDLKEMLEVAHSIVGSEPEHWWEVHHSYKKAQGQYRCYRFTLKFIGEHSLFDCFVQWECDAEGYERGHGFRGQDLGEDWLGGIITDQRMESFLYKVACDEEDAMENGYVLEGRWLLRVIDDETGALVQMRIPASWTKPPSWTAVPSTD
jgi:hypothetical protein